MASTSGVADAATRSLPMSIRRSLIHRRAMYVRARIDAPHERQRARLCGEFGISRKTGYETYDRYKDVGLRRLSDRSRRPSRAALHPGGGGVRGQRGGG